LLLGCCFHKFDQITKTFTLRGFYSYISDPALGTNDIKMIMTNLAYYTNWISRIIGHEDEAPVSTTMLFEYTYNMLNSDFILKTKFDDVTHDNFVVDSIATINPNPSHLLTEDDVSVIRIAYSRGPFIPNGVGTYFPNVLKLQISYSQVEFVNTKMFASFTKLTSLEISSNSMLMTVDEDAFTTLTLLQSLNLDRNVIKTLPANLLTHAEKLKDFSAKYNRIEIVPVGFFDHNLQLAEINFVGNHLTHINADFTKLSALAVIHFNGNKCIDEVFNIQKSSLAEVQAEIIEHCHH